MPVQIARPGTPICSDETTLELGLLNNFSDAGLEGAERQIFDRLNAASGDRLVRLRFFSLPTIARGPAASARLRLLYTTFDQMLKSRLDGLFVTGAEPKQERLQDERFWPALTEVIDWAKASTRTTIWSCLAAHAAVLHVDRIERHALPRKCSGVFAVDRVTSHPLLVGSERDLNVCHSRWNCLREEDLRHAGYTILTRTNVGVDMFAKRLESLFVFFQGHPEYDPGALGREYRRDVLRFLRRESEGYPILPMSYFSRADTTALLAFQKSAERDRDLAAFAAFPRLSSAGAVKSGLALWQNWLDLCADHDQAMFSTRRLVGAVVAPRMLDEVVSLGYEPPLALRL